MDRYFLHRHRFGRGDGGRLHAVLEAYGRKAEGFTPSSAIAKGGGQSFERGRTSASKVFQSGLIAPPRSGIQSIPI